MGRYTARLAAKRADRLRLTAIGVIPIIIGYADLFTAEDDARERKIEQEIADHFGGYDAMIEMFETELVGECSMTVAEAIAHLRNLEDKV